LSHSSSRENLIRFFLLQIDWSLSSATYHHFSTGLNCFKEILIWYQIHAVEIPEWRALCEAELFDLFFLLAAICPATKNVRQLCGIVMEFQFLVDKILGECGGSMNGNHKEEEQDKVAGYVKGYPFLEFFESDEMK
jgi:hypothetical protein